MEYPPNWNRFKTSCETEVVDRLLQMTETQTISFNLLEFPYLPPGPGGQLASWLTSNDLNIEA